MLSDLHTMRPILQGRCTPVAWQSHSMIMASMSQDNMGRSDSHAMKTLSKRQRSHANGLCNFCPDFCNLVRACTIANSQLYRRCLHPLGRVKSIGHIGCCEGLFPSAVCRSCTATPPSMPCTYTASCPSVSPYQSAESSTKQSAGAPTTHILLEAPGYCELHMPVHISSLQWLACIHNAIVSQLICR